MAEAVKKSYNSPLRVEQARATRRAIVAAAARLFVERGYGPTTVDAIAETAGVSRKTVFTSVGGKAEALKLAIDWAIVGDDEPVSLQQRFGMYRWHVPDPIAFESALRVTVQDLGWHRDRRYLKRRDDVASTAFWYHHDPACLPGRHLDIDEMEVGSA